jgi:alkyl hydroperoxide reductase subunit AhpC
LAEKNGTIKKTVGDLIEDKKAEVIEEYPRMDAEEAEKKAKTAVRASVTNYFKELFLAAYDDGNGTEIARIERMLESTGLYEDVEETLTNWKEAYEEELFLKGK